MKVKICTNEEWYPVVCLSDRWGEEVEVPDHVVEDWKRRFLDFDKLQDEMLEWLPEPNPVEGGCLGFGIETTSMPVLTASEIK